MFLQKIENKNLHTDVSPVKNEILNLVKKHSKPGLSPKMKWVYNIKQTLSIASAVYKRKAEYENSTDKNDMELVFILYDELISKYK